MHSIAAKQVRRRGIALIWTAIFLLLLIGLIGLAIDWGFVALTSHQLQNTADAASLAGARLVRTSPADARQAAINTAIANQAAKSPVQLRDNPANDPAGDIVIGRYDRDSGTFTPTLSAPNAVKVLARRTGESPNGPLGLLFGRAFGVETVNVQRPAISMVGGGSGAGLIALNTSERKSLNISGNVTLNVDGGAIQVNSANSVGCYANGNPIILAPEINVCGDYRFDGNVTCEADMHPEAEELPDPLAFLAEVDYTSLPARGTINVDGGGHLDLQPGYYAGGISMNNGSITLAPGIYALDGVGLNITGGDMLADGVMFYIVDSNPSDKLDSHVNLVGNGQLVIRPGDADKHSWPGVSVYEGISFFQARDNENEAKIVGTSGMDLEGTLYFSSANMDISGTSDSLGNQLIADTIEVSGDGEIHINYDGRFPAVGNKIFIVE
jgi:hypothetical protein